MHIPDLLFRAVFTVHSAFRSIMDAIQTNTPNVPFLPDKRLAWITDQWAKEVLSPENIDLTRRSEVVRIIHFKEPNSVQHEYLEVKFKVPAGSSFITVWVRVERTGTPPRDGGTTPDTGASPNANDNNDPPTTGSRPLPTPNPGHTASSSSLNSLTSASTLSRRSSSNPARDTVSIVKFESAGDSDIASNKDDVLRDLVSCGERKLSITEFAVLLRSLSQSAPTYDIIFKNCYWYAGAIYDCVLKEYGASFKPKKGKSDLKSKIYGLPTGASLKLRDAPLDVLWGGWRKEMGVVKDLKTKQQLDDALVAPEREARKAAEEARKAAEEARKAAEKAREEAEKKREEAETKLKVLEERLKRVEASQRASGSPSA